MIRIRLVYEQIETAKAHLLTKSLLGCRLALILLDNAAEILMHRELEHQFAFDDQLMPKWEPARTDWIRLGRGPKYSEDERRDATQHFLPKTEILCLRLGRIGTEDRMCLDVCHRLRNEAFHKGRMRETILEQVCIVHFTTVVGLTVKLPVRSFTLPRNSEDAEFMRRFGLKDAMSLGSQEGHQRCAEHLLSNISIDSSFGAALSDDLLERIDETLGGLEHLNSTHNSDIDRSLQYTQFWRDIGSNLMSEGVREPALENAFLKWQEQGGAVYTLAKIQRWKRQAETLAKCNSPAVALGHFWGVDKRLRPLEEEVSQAVWRYEEEIDAQIH